MCIRSIVSLCPVYLCVLCVPMCALCTYVCPVYLCVPCVPMCVLCMSVCPVYLCVCCVCLCALCTYVCAVYVCVPCVRLCALCMSVCPVYVCVPCVPTYIQYALCTYVCPVYLCVSCVDDYHTYTCIRYASTALHPLSGAALVTTVVGLRVLRYAYGELSRQHMILTLTVLFFNFDYAHLSEGFPLDYFIMSIIFYKVSCVCIPGIVSAAAQLSLDLTGVRSPAQDEVHIRLHRSLECQLELHQACLHPAAAHPSYPLTGAAMLIAMLTNMITNTKEQNDRICTHTVHIHTLYICTH